MIEIKTAGGATYANSFEDIAGLSKKLAEVARAIGAVPKDGSMDFGSTHYRFVSYEGFAAAVRSHLSAAGMSMTIGSSDHNQDGATTTLCAEATFTDNETGAMRIVRWYGESQDKQGRGTAKALTTAVKYGLMRTLLVSEKDDVDPDKDVPTKEPPTKEPPTKKPARPFTPDVLKGMFGKKLDHDMGEPATAGERGRTVGALNSLFTFNGASAESAPDMRHKLTQYLIGQPASAGYTAAECAVLLSWSQDKNDDKEDVPHPMAIKEADWIIDLVKAEQQPLMGDE